ncbi:MAG: fimbrillin family protein [Mucinivorans sp.]
MKKILFLALAIVTVVGCKKSPQSPVENGTDEVIALSTGSVALSKVDPVVNQGERIDFIIGDQIGVFAAYDVKSNQTPAAIPTAPDWTPATEATLKNQTGLYFSNMPAKCTVPGVPGVSTPSVTPAVPATFTWGATGSALTAEKMIYPKGKRSIYLYAYYPYTSTAVDLVLPTDATTNPKLNITLTDGSAYQTQADVLFTHGKSVAGFDTISRGDKLAKLTFKHALAQVQFKVYSTDAAVAACKLLSIEFVAPKKGVMDITTGATAVTSIASGDATTKATYSITENKNAKIPVAVKGASTPYYADALVVLAKPLMVFPLTSDQVKTCELKVKVYFGTKTVESDIVADTDNQKEFTVDLTNVTNTFEIGKTNWLILGISRTTIDLTGDITAWDQTNGNDSDIVVE